MNNKSVALIHYAYPPVVGGVESLVYYYAQLFAKYNYKISVICGRGKNNNPKINFYVIPELQALKIINPQLRQEIDYSSSFSEKVYDFVKLIASKIEPLLINVDFVICHNIFSLALNPCIGLSILNIKNKYPNLKIISWTHDFKLEELDNGKTRRRMKFINYDLENFLYTKNPNLYYVAISNQLLNTFLTLNNFNKNDIKVIPNGINIVDFLNLNSQTELLIKKHKLFKFYPLILLPSKIIPYKNIKICIESIIELINLGYNPKLIITATNFPHSNENSYVSVIKKIIIDNSLQNHIIIASEFFKNENCDISVVKNLYQISDLVLYLSNYENFGLPIIESTLYKTPILCSNLPIFKEIDENNLYITPSLEPKIIAIEISKIISKSQSLFFKNIKQKYNLETIFTDILLPYLYSI